MSPKTVLLLVLSVLLASCAPTSAEVTVTAQVIFTLEPPPTSTETPVPPTATAMATSTPEYPAFSPDMELPLDYSVGQVVGVWYIVDDATKTAVWRFPEGAEKWQAREDVTITDKTTGITDTYEGWITDEGSMEVTTGEIAQMDYVRFSKLENRNINTMTIQPGYVEKYKVVEITDGTAKLDLLFLDMKYLYMYSVLPA